MPPSRADFRSHPTAANSFGSSQKSRQSQIALGIHLPVGIMTCASRKSQLRQPKAVRETAGGAVFGLLSRQARKPWLATAKSGIPSPLKSAAIALDGPYIRRLRADEGFRGGELRCAACAASRHAAKATSPAIGRQLPMISNRLFPTPPYAWR